MFNLRNAKFVVVTDMFGEINEFVGVLTPQLRAVRAQSVTGTCQYCAISGLFLHVTKASGRFHMHCRECVEWLDEIAQDVYEDEDEDVCGDFEHCDDYDDYEPEERECDCCGSVVYVRSIDGYCGSCRSYEKPDV